MVPRSFTAQVDGSRLICLSSALSTRFTYDPSVGELADLFRTHGPADVENHAGHSLTAHAAMACADAPSAFQDPGFSG